MSNVRRVILVLFASLTVISCASGTPRTVITPVTVPVEIEQQWLVPCPELPLLDGVRLSDALKNHTKVANEYHKCKAKHIQLFKAIRAHNGS